jgi:hypothetical protein
MNKFLQTLATAVILTAASSVTHAAKSVSHHGITWTWEEDRQTGQFANGDWWVLGPITLTSITRPNGDPGMDGSQLGPTDAAVWGEQGFDSRMSNLAYKPELNIANALPYSVPVDRSIISSISHIALRDRCQLDYQAVLTVVASEPPAGSFRPSYFGNDKSIKHNASDINYSILSSLAPAGTPPSLQESESAFLYPIIMVGNNYPGINYATAWFNCPLDGYNYGREFSQATSDAALLLNLNYSNTEKELLAIRFIQYGLDIYGGVNLGLKFPAQGGQNAGRKIPMLFAGLLLNDDAIISAADGSLKKFSEDIQHFYVTQQDIDAVPRQSPAGQTADPYPQEALGMSEWGPSGGYPKIDAGYNWSRTYRIVVGPNLTGTALVLKIMGIEAKWNNQAFLDYYIKRFVPIERNGDFIPKWHLAMWDKHMVGYMDGMEKPSAPTGLRIEE